MKHDQTRFCPVGVGPTALGAACSPDASGSVSSGVGFPVAVRRVSRTSRWLSIGSVDPLNEAYVLAVRELRRRIDAESVSDHLCFSSVGGRTPPP